MHISKFKYHLLSDKKCKKMYLLSIKIYQAFYFGIFLFGIIIVTIYEK